jgi:hypothetical protein
MSAVIIAVVVLLAASISSAVAQQQRTHQLPTATEVFNLRSRCAALGEQILEANMAGSALTESQVSHYEPRTNRCYVELTVQTADLNKPFNQQYHSRVLYDGQTKEMLAYARIERGTKSGNVFDQQHWSTSAENAGWDDAIAYIKEKMAGDR